MIPYRYSQLKNRISFKYAVDKYNHKTPKYHLGQLKLMITELFFLSKVSKPNNKVLYVGAANGYHIEKLAELFPSLQFDLWDPGHFEVKEGKNIKIFRKFFTDDEANKYATEGSNILFMCDMRTLKIAEYKKQNDNEAMDYLVMDDMSMQQKWIQIINPIYAYLKFRLPYDIPKFKYLKGTIYLQPYSPLSTETRLLTNNYHSFKEYDSLEFDEKLAHFNYIDKYQIKTDKFKDCMQKYKFKNMWDNILALYVSKYYIFRKYNIKSDEKACELFMDIIKFHQKRFGNKYDILFDK